MLYTGGAIPQIADYMPEGGRPYGRALSVTRSMSSFDPEYTRRHPAFRKGLSGNLQASVRAWIDYFNSYQTFYDDNHLNQKGKFFPDGDASHAGAFWEFDCVGFTERIYEQIGWDLTGGNAEWWYGFWPADQRDSGVSIPPPVRVVPGRFGMDTLTDLALVGGSGWATIPVALANGNGNFTIVNGAASNFASWAQTDRAQVLAGDFNGDQFTDIALTGGAGWASVPVAVSRADGTFGVTNFGLATFPEWAATPGVQAVAGDFDGDGDDDIALTGGTGWGTIPVAFSNGNQTFSVTNAAVSHAPSWGATPGVKVVSGDFNNDGRADLAFVNGPASWGSLPVALSNGNGAFTPLAYPLQHFSIWGSQPGAKPVVGDFNGDNLTDIALVGGGGWSTVQVAFGYGNGEFFPASYGVAHIPDWSQQAGVQAVPGHFDADGATDIYLAAGAGWTTLGVAVAQPGAGFYALGYSSPTFAGWAGN
jgi:hypothetical protein